MICAGCKTESKAVNYYTCCNTSCKDIYCSTCSKTPNLTASRQKTWICPSCCAKTKKTGDYTNSPIRSSNDSSSCNVTIRSKPSPAADNVETSNDELKVLTSELRRLNQLIGSLKDKLDEATLSLTKCHERLDELASASASTDDRLRKLEARDLEIVELKSSVTMLNRELNTQAQYQLRNEIEIAGLPEAVNENLHHTVLLLSKKVGVDLDDRDIDWVTRVGPKKSPSTSEDKPNFPRPVVVRLLRRAKRDQLTKAAKSRRNLTSADVEIPGPALKVFINERLTKTNRLLFRDARALSKGKGFAHCWSTNGNIYVRQREGKPAKQIACQDDLERVFKDTASMSSNK